MSHIRSVFEGLRRKNEGVEDTIKELIDTNFSASDDEKGKAAEMLKGLFFSDDPKAQELIKKLDNWFSQQKDSLSEDDSLDDDGPIFKTLIIAQKKINQKSTAEKSSIYQYMVTKLIGICDENAQTKTRARKFLIELMRSNFKKDEI